VADPRVLIIDDRADFRALLCHHVTARWPGALAAVADQLGSAGINIHYGYLGTARSASRASLFLSVDDPASAARVLRRKRRG